MATRTVSDRPEKTVTLRFNAGAFVGGEVQVPRSDGAVDVRPFTAAEAGAVGTPAQRTNTVDYMTALVAAALTSLGYT
jgi:hypothetical protein